MRRDSIVASTHAPFDESSEFCATLRKILTDQQNAAKPVHVAFDAPFTTSDGGALLLKAADQCLVSVARAKVMRLGLEWGASAWALNEPLRSSGCHA